MIQKKVIVRGLSKAFGGKVVLKDIDLELPRGKSLVVIGGSGCGKSVLIKNVIGLMRPTSGSIQVDGTEMTTLSERERSKLMVKFGMLFQGGALFDSLPVWKNVSFVALQSKMLTMQEAYDLAIKKLQAVGLSSEVAGLYPAELSGGMQKRVALARAIAHDPEIIFFDEPTTGLDPIMADVINDLIIKCSEELGATILTITHDMSSARKIGDYIGMLHGGRFIWNGKIEDLDHSGNPYVEQFIHGRAEGPIQMQLQDHFL